MAFLAAIPVRAGLKHKRKLFLTNPADKRPDWENTYEPQNYANVIEDSLGIKLDSDILRQLCLPAIKPEEMRAVDNLFQSNSIENDKPIITISPFTSWLPKNWPVDYYIQLVDLLKGKYACQIILLGTALDLKQSGYLGCHPNIINLMGKTTIIQTIEVIKRSNLFIGGCSAPLHIAGVYNIPFVAMYGATSPERWAPRSRGIVLTRNLGCGPCSITMTGCEEKPCMYNISVEEVFGACCRMLEQN